MQKKYQTINFSFLFLMIIGIWDAKGSSATCSVNVSEMKFGLYDPLNGLPVATTASIDVTCTATIVGTQVAYQIKLNPGNSGNYGTRQMVNDVNVLNYNIYTDLKYQNILGDGTSGTQILSDGYIIDQIQNYVKSYSIYGLIPAKQGVPGGVYSDSVIVTVNF